MAEYQITYWSEIPSMVTAREGRRNIAKVELPARFQEAIDEAAMRMRLTGTDAYLEEWRKGDWQEHVGTPQEVAKSIAAELETTYTSEHIREIIARLAPRQ